jgi:hypothetical protein
MKVQKIKKAFMQLLFDLMLSDWVSFLAYPNLFGIKGFVVVVVFMQLFIKFATAYMILIRIPSPGIISTLKQR